MADQHDHTPAAPHPERRRPPAPATTPTDLLAEGQARGVRDAMDLIVRACDQALADARLAAIGATGSPLQRLVDDLQREKAAALRCRAIVDRHVAAAAAEMRDEAEATGDTYMQRIAAAFEAGDYRDLAP